MYMVRNYFLKQIIIMAMIVLVGAGCTPGPEAATRPETEATQSADAVETALPALGNPPDAALQAQGVEVGTEVTLDAVEIMILESFPVQVNAVIRGSLPDSCVTIDQINQGRNGDTFEIAIATVREIGAMCATQRQPFEESVSLDVLGLPAGTYTVTASGTNSVSNTFALAVDNIPAEISPTPELVNGSISGIVWDDACQPAEDGAPASGCQAGDDGGQRANGVFDSDERRIPGVEVQLYQGECPAGETPIGVSTTDESGTYLFTGLSAGSYCVAVDPASAANAALLLPGNWTYPAVDVGQTTVTLAGSNYQTADFGWDYESDRPLESEPAESEPAAACQDAARYLSDVTIPDDTVFSPGETFVKTWRVLNEGDCVWGPGYNLVYSGGDQLGQATTAPFSGTTEPGGEADLSVELTAPAEAGTYRSEWKFQRPDGEIFGSNGDFPIYVQIVVSE